MPKLPFNTNASRYEAHGCISFTRVRFDTRHIAVERRQGVRRFGAAFCISLQTLNI